MDIDGVVADSFPVFLKEINEYYGKNITIIDHYDMAKVFNVPWEEMRFFFEENMEHLYKSPKPVSGAVSGIYSLLEKGHEIIYVTARTCGAQEEATCRWFDAHKIPKEKIVFAGGTSKTQAVKDFSIDIFVEDFIDNALDIASLGIPVLLLDSPYNQAVLPPNIIRCYSWKEIMDNIEQYSKSLSGQDLPSKK